MRDLAVMFLLLGMAIAVFRRAWLIPHVLAIMSYNRWDANERAMRLGEALPASNLTRVLAFGVGVAATIAAVVAMFGPK